MIDKNNTKLKIHENCSSVDSQGIVVIVDNNISKIEVSPTEIKLVQAHFKDFLLKIFSGESQ
jgi:hypothetical protein